MSNQIIQKPAAGTIDNNTPMEGRSASLNFTLEQVDNFNLVGNALEIRMDDGGIVMIDNFEALANSSENTFLTLADGNVIEPAKLYMALNDGQSAPQSIMTNDIVIGQPDVNVTREINMKPGQSFKFDFDPYQAKNIEMIDDEMVISFDTNGSLILRGFNDVVEGELPPAMSLADGRVIDASELLSTIQLAIAGKDSLTDADDAQYANDDISPEALQEMLAIQPAAGDMGENQTGNFPFQELSQGELEQRRADGLATDNEHTSRDDAAMNQQAEQLAAIETAAGGNGGGSRGGFGFSSQVESVRLNTLNAVGPINATKLQYKAPEQDQESFIPENEQRLNTAGAEFESTQVKEDGSVNMLFVATGNESASIQTTITISNISTGWGLSAPVGTFEPATGTWTAVISGDQTLSEILTFTPPAETDVDLSGALITITNFDPATGLSSTFTGTFDIGVDAVADVPTIVAQDDTGHEGDDLDVDLAGLLGTDNFDGSESIVSYTISDVPTEYQFSNGNFTINAGSLTADWTFTPAEIAGLRVSHTDTTFVGSITLTATVNTAETTLSGTEFDTTDNTNSASDDFTLTWKPVVNPPEVYVFPRSESDIIDEDTYADIEIGAMLDPAGSGNEILSVTVTGINATWGFDHAAAGGTYNAATGTWTITMPANTNFNSTFRFTPPAESDIDLTGLQVTATALEPATMTTASASDNFQIIVDAVADKPDVDGADNAGNEGQPLAVNVTGMLGTDNFDGSESITGYRISGVPTGFTLSAGTATAVAGEYDLTEAELVGLTITPPANYVGSIDLTATILTAETNTTDIEPDLTDNTNFDTDDLTLTWKPQAEPPTLEAGHYCVYEDGQEYDGVGVPTGVDFNIVSALPVTATAAAYLTITMSGIDTSWTMTDAAGGTYNAATGTWTFTSAAGADFIGGPSFFPPADEDLDMATILVTATTTEPATGDTATVSDTTHVVLDAVADTPDVAAKDVAGEEDKWFDLDVSAALNDLDSSETLEVEISGMPTGALLNAGTDLGAGVWSIPVASLSTLQIKTVAGYEGTFEMTITAIATETNKSETPDTDFHFLNDVAKNSAKFDVTVDGDDTPVIVKPAKKIVDDTNLEFGDDVVSGTLQADFFNDAPGTFGTINTFTYNGSVKNGLLASGGNPVTVTESATGYVGIANGQTIFTLDLVAATGDYTFTLNQPLDHADVTDHNDYMYLYFGVEAIDSDGDTDDTVITIKVRDDGLTAEDDTGNVDLATGTATGNVVDNDDLSQDVENTVTEVNGQAISQTSGSTTTLAGKYGSLEIDANGNYEYTPNGTSSYNTPEQTVTFAPTATNAAGQQTSITLNGITVAIANTGSFDISWLDTSDGSGLGIDNLTNGDSKKMWPTGEGFNITTAKAAKELEITISEIGSNSNYGQHGVEVDVTLADGSVVTKEIQLDPALITNGHFTFDLNSSEFGGQLITSVKLYSEDAGQFRGASLLLNNVEATYPGECGCRKDEFEYTLTDKDGDTSTATLTIDCVKSVMIVGQNVNDVDGSTTPYTVGNGNGTITGLAGADILIGDTGGSDVTPQDQDYNFAFILDVSTSMGAYNDPTTRLFKLIDAVKTQAADYKAYVDNGYGEINVSIVPFSSKSTQSVTYNLNDPDGYSDLITYVESLRHNGYTNYEAGLQNALGVIGGLPANASAELVTYFITDGDPNYYLNDAGQVVLNASATTSMNQINGTGDSTNEIADLLAASAQVIGVGINVGVDGMARIGQIDSDGNPINIQDANDLSSALQAADPISSFDQVGNDNIEGNAGDDLIFGDVLFTDTLAAAHGLATETGAGWEVFGQLEAGQSALNAAWTRADTVAYIQNNGTELAQESVGVLGETRTGGNDVILGGAGNDNIFGQEGNDNINGGTGIDNLYGGSGADIFIFDNVGDADTIGDFNVAEGDSLQLDGILDNYDAVTDAITDFVFSTEVGGNTVISVDTLGTGNAANAQNLVTLEGQTGISIADLFNDGTLLVA